MLGAGTLVWGTAGVRGSWAGAGRVPVPSRGSVGAPVRACPGTGRLQSVGGGERLPGLPGPWPVSQGRCLRFLGRIEGCRVAMETE